jgi:D-glycero-D-manno-heptose 1,7-bisphosphate phosphatase
MVKAVFFDRDGVLNPLVPHVTNLVSQLTAPWSYKEFSLFDGVKETVQKFKDAGFLTFVVTNQPDVCDGNLPIQDLHEINSELYSVGFDRVLCAMNRNNWFYKPNPGMIEKLLTEYKLDPKDCYMIGDRWKDIVPAHKLGLTTIFMGHIYSCPQDVSDIRPTYYATNISDAYDIIMGDNHD